MNDILKNFFAEYDVASLRAKVLEQEGVDIQGVYCLHTGKIMGTYDESEIRFAVDEIGTDDDELLVDDLLVRVVASMRPSPAMNKPDRLTLREMVSSRPVDALMFLANRLHGHRDLLTSRSDASFQPLVMRITEHRRWSRMFREGLDLTPWIHWLLELDAKMNLHDTPAPCIAQDKKNRWVLADQGTPLLWMVTATNAAEMLSVFESWVFKQLEKYEKRDSELLAQAKWIRGNTFAAPAYVRSWIENPQYATRKAEATAKAKGKKTPTGRPVTSERAKKLNAETNQFLHLLEGILDGTLETDTPKPAPKPRVLTGGMLKLNIAKKEG